MTDRQPPPRTSASGGCGVWKGPPNMTTDRPRDGSPNDDPAAHMTEKLAEYELLDDAALAALVRQYAIAPEGLHWTERAALLAAVADRLDQIGGEQQ
jgi:hypothetical protein